MHHQVAFDSTDQTDPRNYPFRVSPFISLQHRFRMKFKNALHDHRAETLNLVETLRVLFNRPGIRVVHQALGQFLEDECVKTGALNCVPEGCPNGIGSDREVRTLIPPQKPVTFGHDEIYDFVDFQVIREDVYAAMQEEASFQTLFSFIVRVEDCLAILFDSQLPLIHPYQDELECLGRVLRKA